MQRNCYTTIYVYTIIYTRLFHSLIKPANSNDYKTPYPDRQELIFKITYFEWPIVQAVYSKY